MKCFRIADAHGIESFFKGDIDDKENAERCMILHMRAGVNRHRHAVVYLADISESAAEDIEDLLKDSEYKEALVRLKLAAPTVSLTRLPGAEKSWEMIPNSALDPYHA